MYGILQLQQFVQEQGHVVHRLKLLWAHFLKAYLPSEANRGLRFLPLIPQLCDEKVVMALDRSNGCQITQGYLLKLLSNLSFWLYRSTNPLLLQMESWILVRLFVDSRFVGRKLYALPYIFINFYGLQSLKYLLSSFYMYRSMIYWGIFHFKSSIFGWSLTSYLLLRRRVFF